MAQTSGASSTSAPLRTTTSSPAVVCSVASDFSPPAKVMSKSAREHGTSMDRTDLDVSSNSSATVKHAPRLEGRASAGASAFNASIVTTTATITAGANTDAEIRAPSPAEPLIAALRSPDQKQFDQVFKKIKQAAAQEAKASHKPALMAKRVAERINTVVEVPEATWGPTTPLITAVRGNKLHCVNLLLSAGADPNQLVGESGTALMFAMDLDYAKVLLQAGANPNLACPYKGSALIHALVSEWNPEVIQALLDHGADVNQPGFHPFAVLTLDILGQCWQYMARSKDLHAAPPVSPLMAAASTGNAALINLMIKAGAELNCKSGPKDFTPLMVTVTANKPAAAKALLAAGANLAALDRDGNTALHLASSRGHAEVIALLTRAGADLSIRNGEGKTALMIVNDGLLAPTWAAKERLEAARSVLVDAESMRSSQD